MIDRAKYYIDWVWSLSKNMKRRTRHGCDLYTLDGSQLAHIRYAKSYRIEKVGDKEIARDKVKWWIYTDRVNNKTHTAMIHGIWSIETRKRINKGFADNFEQAQLAVQHSLEILGYKQLPKNLVNML